MFDSGHHIDFTDETAMEGRLVIRIAPTVENFDCNNQGTIPGAEQERKMRGEERRESIKQKPKQKEKGNTDLP